MVQVDDTVKKNVLNVSGCVNPLLVVLGNSNIAAKGRNGRNVRADIELV